MTRQPRKNRSVEKAEYRGGFEPLIAKILSHNRQKYKYNDLYESIKFDINIPKTYTPDFVLEYPDGRKKIIECKGYFPDEDRKKCLAFRRQYPDYDYLIIFQRNNSLYRGSKIKYGDWCTKNGIEWSVGEIPEEFFER